MNPLLEIVDALVESFSTILGRPRRPQSGRGEELERPVDLPGAQSQFTPEEEAAIESAFSTEPSSETNPAPTLPAEAASSTESPAEIPASEPEEEPPVASPDETGEIDPDRPGDMPPAEEEPAPQSTAQPESNIQDIREEEEGTAAPAPSAPVEPQPLPEPVERKVLVIHFDPAVPSARGRHLSDALAGQDPEELLRVFISDLRECSAGYARYRVVERINIERLPVKCDGFQYSADHYFQCWQGKTGFHVPDMVDYARIFEEADIAKKVNEGIVDEVWLFGPPYCGFYESIMAGKAAFYLNAPALNLPEKMDRRVVLMGFNYERGAGEMLESYGHRAEDILRRVFQDTRGNSNLWERFTRFDRSNPGKSEVGTIHYAPNSEKDYDWGNSREVMSRCDTWLSFPDLSGSAKMVKAEDWGNGDIRAHHKWWFSRIPHVAGVNEGIDLNWWKYIVDLNEVK